MARSTPHSTRCSAFFSATLMLYRFSTSIRSTGRDAAAQRNPCASALQNESLVWDAYPMRKRLPLKIRTLDAYFLWSLRRSRPCSSSVRSNRKQTVRSRSVRSTSSARENACRSSSNARRILHARETPSSVCDDPDNFLFLRLAIARNYRIGEFRTVAGLGHVREGLTWCSLHIEDSGNIPRGSHC